MKISVIIPAFQEEACIETCLASVLLQDLAEPGTAQSEIIVVANGCTDATVARARRMTDAARRHGFLLSVLDLPRPGKARALNAGSRAATGDIHVYLDADVTCERELLRLLAGALDADAPRYASGILTVMPARNWISRCYARVWNQLPFVAKGVAGCGLYAVNRAGRARWTEFPDIHSDDKFVRLQFAPEERVRVDARYFWPVPEGLRNLVRVRRRWCEGNAELSRTFPQLMKRPVGETGRYEALGRLVLAAPFSAVLFTVVFVVSLMLALGPSRTAPTTWRRGR